MSVLHVIFRSIGSVNTYLVVYREACPSYIAILPVPTTTSTYIQVPRLAAACCCYPAFRYCEVRLRDSGGHKAMSLRADEKNSA